MRNQLINEIQELLDPRPGFAVFRHVNGELYSHNGETLTKAQCDNINARTKIYVKRKITPIVR